MIHNFFFRKSPFTYPFYRNMMVLRVHGEDLVFPTPLHQVNPRIPQMNMMKVHIPFTFKLIETSKSSYSGKSWTIHLRRVVYVTFLKNNRYIVLMLSRKQGHNGFGGRN